MNTLTKITAASALFGAVAAGALVPAATAEAATRPAAAVTSPHTAAPDLMSPLDAAAHEEVPAIAPDGTRVYSTTDRIAPPRRAGAADARSAAQPWLPGRSAGSGVRIRTSPVTGTILGLIPFQGHLSMSCKVGGSDGWNWYWTAYNPGGRWIYGWTSSMWIYPSPDAYVPPC